MMLFRMDNAGSKNRAFEPYTLRDSVLRTII